MLAPSGQMTAPVVQALLKGRDPGRKWALDPGRSSIRLKNKIIGLVPVNACENIWMTWARLPTQPA